VTTYGVDTSHWKWSPGIDFAAMKRSGRCDYLIAKATEGTGYVDPSYGGWRAGAKNAGMVFGSFHFARPGDPVEQAEYYLSVARPVDGDIPVLDLEDTAIPDPPGFAVAFAKRVQSKTGTWPLLYTYPNYLAAHDFRPLQALGCPLWFADYSDPLNSIKPWSSYAIRQFTDRGTVPGLPGTLDCNSSPLTLDQLRALAIGAQEDDMPLSDADVEKVAGAVWGKVVKYGAANAAAFQVLGDMFGNVRDIAGLTAKMAATDQGSGVTAADIAAAIPADLAQQVVDELAKRLNS
jgi:GH25 family lysozyme M1 (1,4-beta-N-acetylmuramidase)